MAELDLEWEANKQEDEQFAAAEVDYANAGYDAPITKWERNFFEDGYRRGVKVALNLSDEERDAALSTIAKVEALHHKITRYGNDMHSISAESYEDDPSSYEDLEPFDLCAECYEVEKMICEECGGDAPIGHRSNYPCPTARALGSGPSTGEGNE